MSHYLMPHLVALTDFLAVVVKVVSLAMKCATSSFWLLVLSPLLVCSS